MSLSGDQDAAWVVDIDSEIEMDTQAADGDFEMTMETEMDESVEPSFQKRRNTWPGSLLTAKALKKADEQLEDTEGEKPAANVEDASPAARKMSTRRNAWGNMSYAEMITTAIESTPEKRMTLAQIYDWIVKNVPYFQDKGDNSSSASWKNSVRHNLSLHSQFTKLQNEGTGKSSWWVVNPEASMQRRRARTMESGAFDRKRGRGRLKTLGSTPTSISTIDESLSGPGTRCRSGSSASSLGRLSPIQAEAETESASDEWDPQQNPLPVQNTKTPFLVSGSTGAMIAETVPPFPVPGTTWQNFSITLKDSSPLVVPSVPTTVLFVDQPIQVSASMLQNDRGVVPQPAPMIVLLTAPQTALTQYIQPSGSCVSVPSLSPSNGISCVTFQKTIEACSTTSGAQQKSSEPIFLDDSGSSVAVQNEPVSSFPSSDAAPSSSSLSVPRSQSVSKHYVQFLKLLSSKQMQEYMKFKPGFYDKFRKLLLAKKEKMMQEMNEQKKEEPKFIRHESIFCENARPTNVQRPQEIVRSSRIQLEESMNSISLNSEKLADGTSLFGSKMQQNDSLSNFGNEFPQQLASFDLDFEQVINQDLERDLLLDLSFDSLAGDLGCDEDFLSQF